jgi:hypothetical protein
MNKNYKTGIKFIEQNEQVVGGITESITVEHITSTSSRDVAIAYAMGRITRRFGKVTVLDVKISEGICLSGEMVYTIA